MASESFKPEDVGRIERILRNYPDAYEVARTVTDVSRKVTYPIHTFDDLEKAMGGSQATVSFRGQPMSLEEVRKRIPAYYFPISSEDDLIAKVADLEQHGGRPGPVLGPVHDPVGQGMRWAAPIPMPQGLARPELTEAQLAALRGPVEHATSGIGDRTKEMM